MRTPTGSSPPPENSALPHSEQNDLGNPFSGAQVRTASSPAVIRKCSGAIRALIDHAVPVRRWQRWQWQ